MDVRPMQSTVSQSRRLQDFFFAEEVPYGLALIRIILPLILLCVVLPRWVHTRELYSADGAPAPLAINYGFDGPPQPGGALAVAMMSVLAFSLVTSSLGWHTRLSLITSLVIYTWLNMLDCLSTFTKYSVIASHVLLLLSLSSCGMVWSLDALRKGQAEALRAPVWPRRLVQLLIGTVYLGAAFTKLHTGGFLSSDQLRFWLLTNVNNDNPLGELLAMYPSVIIIAAHVALIWQILFLFLAWRGRARGLMLSIGAGFHIATTPLLGLFIFPPVMLATYLAWVDERDVARWRPHVQRLWTWLQGSLPARPALPPRALQTLATVSARAAVPGAVLWTLAAAGVAVAGVELEYRIDPYGERRPEGPYALEEIPHDEAMRLLQHSPRIHPADKVLALEVGTDLLGGVIINRRYEFHRGDRFIAQCSLVPPHEDMWVRCRIEDSDGHAAHRSRELATREMLRVNFTFAIPESMEPGDYRLVLSVGGKDVASRNVHVD